MRELLVKYRANNKVEEIADFIVTTYKMPLTAINYAQRIIDFMLDLQKNPFAYAICRNYILSKNNLRCATFEKRWIVVYKVTEKHIIVEDIILGSTIV